ncbi:MAG: DUF2809 domain-containing protein [Acidobacteriota bacterium]
MSRLMPLGFRLWDKYLGDVLYAAMVYEILRLSWRPRALGAWAMAVMTGIEVFQLTGVPAWLVGSEHLAARICGRLMGTEFSFADLLAYAVGIGCMVWVDSRGTKRDLTNPRSEHASNDD